MAEKYFGNTGLRKLLTLIKNSFVSATDVVSCNVVDIDTVPQPDSSNLLTSGAIYTLVQGKQDKIGPGVYIDSSYVTNLSTVSRTGSYNDLTNKPTITNVNESTVAGWGFTKNTGTVTTIKFNPNGGSQTTKNPDASGNVDLGNIITSHQSLTDYAKIADVSNGLDTKQNTLSQAQLDAVNSGINTTKVTTYDGYATSKQNVSNLVTSIDASSLDTQYPSAKCMYTLVGNVVNLLNNI